MAHDNSRSCAGGGTGADSAGGRNTPAAQAARNALYPPTESTPLVDFRISNGITAIAEVRDAIDGSVGWPRSAASRFASIATTSIYLQSDKAKRFLQMGQIFAAP